MPTDRDRIYAQPLSEVDNFKFDDNVARVFPDMISRSVPGYAAITEMISVLAGRYAQPNSRCYDLGCSLGAATRAILGGVRQTDCHIVGIDNSPAMVARCQEVLADVCGQNTLEIICADVRETRLENASFVVMNFTLQFISTDDRLHVLHEIYRGMTPGGALVLSEKIRFEDPFQQVQYDELHREFKRAHGYSELEISQKRAALETVLIPETADQHLQRLRASGFSSAHLWYQCLNFASFLAIK